MRVKTLAFLAALFASAFSATACEVSQGAIADFGGAIMMRVKPGETCNYDLVANTNGARNAGQAQLLNIVFLSMHVAKRPSLGRAGISGRSGIAYIAAPNFAGADNFTVEMTTERNGQQRTSNITVAVEAQR